MPKESQKKKTQIKAVFLNEKNAALLFSYAEDNDTFFGRGMYVRR